MLRAALTSRSCTAPQWQQVHPLIPRPALPFGLLAGMIPQLLKDGVFDTANSGVILRGGGPADYFEISDEQRFRMYRPS